MEYKFIAIDLLIGLRCLLIITPLFPHEVLHKNRVRARAMDQESEIEKAETTEEGLSAEDNCNRIKIDATSSSDDETDIQEELKEVAALQAAHQNHVMRIEDKMRVETTRKTSLGEEAVFALNKVDVREKAPLPDHHELSNVARLNVYRINSKFERLKNLERFDWKTGEEAGEKLHNVHEKAPNLSTHAYPFHEQTSFDAKTITRQVKDVLGQVKDREEHERILDAKDKLLQRFDTNKYNLLMNKTTVSEPKASPIRDVVEGNPKKIVMGDRHNGVLKISDRSLCGNGEDDLWINFESILVVQFLKKTSKHEIMYYGYKVFGWRLCKLYFVIIYHGY